MLCLLKSCITKKDQQNGPKRVQASNETNHQIHDGGKNNLVTYSMHHGQKRVSSSNGTSHYICMQYSQTQTR
jgi:hypothetical protein